jgi:hypothetical protein
MTFYLALFAVVALSILAQYYWMGVAYRTQRSPFVALAGLLTTGALGIVAMVLIGTLLT